MLSWHDTLAIAFRNRTLFAPPGEEPTESVSVASAADKNFTLLSCCCCCLLILLLPEPNTHNRATSTQKKTPPAAESTQSVKVRQQQQSAAVTSNVKITQFHAHHHRPRFTRTSFRRPQKKQQEKEQSKAARRQQVWTEFWATFGPDPEQRTGGRDGRGFHASDSTGTETVWGTLQRTGTGFDEDRTEHRNQRARKCRETHTLARDWRKVTAGRKVERMKGRGNVGGQDNHF